MSNEAPSGAREARAEVAIVGAGPVGLELAVALKREGVSCIHFDAGQIGSTIEWYAPQTHFFSSPERIAIAGVPLQTLDQTKATREEYLTYLRAVVQQFDLSIETFARVTSISRSAGHELELTFEKANQVRRTKVRNVVLAIGDMHRPRRLDVAGEDLPHVSHYFGDPHRYFRRKVLVAGGKNSAVEAAIRCFRVGADVSLSYRRAELDPAHVKFWLLPELRALLREGRITFHPETTIAAISPDDVLLEGPGGRTKRIAADAVLLMTGYEQDSTLFEIAGIRLEGEGKRPVFSDETMETNVPGIFVAGTATAGTQLGGVKQFIETSHIHVDKIVAAITGRSRKQHLEAVFELPES